MVVASDKLAAANSLLNELRRMLAEVEFQTTPASAKVRKELKNKIQNCQLVIRELPRQKSPDPRIEWTT